jgi:hypothetical protein
MGADGRCGAVRKRREWLHEAIDFIRVFADFGPLLDLPSNLKKG